MPEKIKPKIETVVQELLDGEMLTSFNEFLNFLKNEKISLPWTSFNGFNMNYRGKRIGKIYLGRGINFIEILVDTVGCFGYDYDAYLEGQPSDIAEMLLERVSNKCVHCRPTCSCSHSSGGTVQIHGSLYENACVNSTLYHFKNSDKNINTMIMTKPCAGEFPEGTPSERTVPVEFPIETVKKLIMVKKKYIEKTLSPGTK